MKTGIANLPLHRGRAPKWLFDRMQALAREIVVYLVGEFGPDDVLRRLSDPFWFQAFGCVLGFDWHSSGVTTTVCGALKEGLKGLETDTGLYVAGGKGGRSRKTPAEIEAFCGHISLDAAPLVYASRMSAKVDSAGVQDGFQIYQHCFIFTGAGKWTVIQQGMNEETRYARRYHWHSDGVSDFVCEPHAAVCCDQRVEPLNMVARESEGARQASAEAANQHPEQLAREFERVATLAMPRRHQMLARDLDSKRVRSIMLKAYEASPTNFEQLLGLPGVGPKTIRALSLVAELVYGQPASCRDPARYSFAHGGKDGIPYPVDRQTYDETIDVLRKSLNATKVDLSEKRRAFKRLARFERG